MEEVWKDVVGFEGLYEVSSHGRVRSMPKKVCRGGSRAACYMIKGRILEGWSLGRYGHRFVGLYPKTGGRGSVLTFAVHRLVLEAFVGPCPPGMECCHFPDRDPTNNRLDNLRWDTHKANSADRELHGTHPHGSASTKAKLTEADIPAIRARKSKKWGAMSKVAREYGVDAATIRDIWVGKTWRHVPE